MNVIKTIRNVLLKILIVGCVLLGIILIWAVYETHQKGEYKTFTSPDGKYEVILYAYNMLICMPGQSSDASGLLCLYDKRTGKELHSCKVDMVQLVDHESMEWSSTNVYIKLIADWPLPK